MQGLFIFLFHVVFNDDVREACGKYKKRAVTVMSNLTARERPDQMCGIRVRARVGFDLYQM